MPDCRYPLTPREARERQQVRDARELAALIRDEREDDREVTRRENPFKPGDRVICVHGHPVVEAGEECTIAHVEGNQVRVEGDTGLLLNGRFRAVPKADPSKVGRKVIAYPDLAGHRAYQHQDAVIVQHSTPSRRATFREIGLRQWFMHGGELCLKTDCETAVCVSTGGAKHFGNYSPVRCELVDVEIRVLPRG